MEKDFAVKWYYYKDFDGFHVMELEFINNITHESFWKMYKNKNRDKLNAICKAQETKFFNKLAMVF